MSKQKSSKSGIITKTISIPKDLFEAADKKVAADPETDWSTYVRKLIRKDLVNESPAPSEPIAA